MNSKLGLHKNFFISGLMMFASSIVLSGQNRLTEKQITAAEALGKNTNVPLRLGSLLPEQKGLAFQAFITTPTQRIAYAASDLHSESHGSGVADPLSSELHFNRLRVTGLPYPLGANQHNSRHVLVCNARGGGCIKPAREVIDVNQVVAEFQMPAVIHLALPSSNLIVRIRTDSGDFEPDLRINLDTLNKKTPLLK